MQFLKYVIDGQSVFWSFIVLFCFLFFVWVVMCLQVGWGVDFWGLTIKNDTSTGILKALRDATPFLPCSVPVNRMLDTCCMLIFLFLLPVGCVSPYHSFI